MTDTIKTVNKTKLSNGEIRYYEDTQARNDITDIKTRFNDLSVNFDSKQDKLIAGDNITITAENVISASGVDDYNQLNNKPTLDGVTLEGDMHFSDFELKTSDLINDEGFLNKDSVVAGEGISISETPDGILVENTQTSAEWGKISGNIFNQLDLQSEFESKQDKLTAGSYIDIEKDSEGKTIISTSGGNYNSLDNKPSIDGHVIEGDMKASEVINLGGIQVSSFINDVPYQTPADIKAHNESAASHADIRQQINIEVGNRETADSNLQEQIDALASSSDVIDILGSYAELQRYDTSHVKENDIIKVIQDETRENAVTYYRWLFDRDSEGNPLFDSEGNHEGRWSFIGEQGPYYTSAQVDDKFVPQSRNINGHDLRQDVTLHYSDLGSIPDNAILSDAKVTFKKNATSHREYDSEGNPVWVIDYNSGETMGIISMNQSGDGVINYNIPTNVNQLEGFSDLAQASNYYNKDLTDDLLDEKQDVLVAGAGITIENNSEGKPVISSTSTGVTWGNIVGDIGDQADLQSALAGKQTLITSSNKLDSTLISGLSNVATSGSYNDLVDVPDITGGTGISVTKDSQGDFVVSNTMSDLEWGNLTGNISNQTDLKDALDDIQNEIDSKQDQLVAGDGIDITLNSSGEPVISNTRVSAVWGNIEGTLTDQVDLTNVLSGKVDKETGKGLSTNDFTTSYKNKLDGIESNAEVNVIETVKRNGVDLEVTNKSVNILVPTTVAELSDSSDYVTDLELTTALSDKVDKVTGKQLSTNDFTDILKDKLDGIEAHAEINSLESISVNNDTISISGKNANLTIEGSSPINVSTQNGVVTVSHAASGVTTGSKGDSSNQTPGFGDTFKVTSGTVNTSGHMTAFEDHIVTIPSSVASASDDGLMSSTDKIKLSGIDTNAQVNTIESISENGTTLTITNKNVDITVPVKTSDLTNDGNGATPVDPFATQSAVSIVNTKVTNLETRVDNIIASGGEPNTINHIQKNGIELPITNKTVNVIVPTKTSELSNDSQFITTSEATALIPTKTSDLTNDGDGTSNFATESYVTTGLADKQDTLTAGSNIDITSDTISVTGLANVATTGDYSDLNNAPTGTLTIQKNGTNVATFSADQTTNVTANISVPTKVSDLTNDTGFGTITEVVAGSGLTGGGTNGSISLGHSNSITAQTTSGLYPIKIDAQGHITEYGEAVDIHEMVVLRYGVSTWSDFIDAYKHNAIVYCRASSNSNPATGSQTRMAFMAYVNNADNPTNVEFQYYRSVSSHTFDLQGDEVYIYKLESNNNWSVTVRKAYSKVDTENGLAHTFSGGTSSVVKLKANLQSEIKLSNDSAAATEVSGRVYPVALDKSGYLAVNVPWTDSVNDVKVNGTSILSSGVADLITNTAYDSTDNKIATMSDVSSMGTVKSVQVAATGPIQSSQNTSQTETLSTTISLADAYGDTKNPYGSKTKNFVLASPSNANGTPSFRALTTADIPNITVSKISDFPTIPDKTSDLTNDSDFVSDASYVHTDNNFTTVLKNKLDGIAAGAEVNVQADWNETDSTSDAYIKNKPSIPEGASAGSTVTAVGTTAVVGTSTSFAREDHVHNITSSTITSVLGFTPYNSTNPNGYQTASQVNTAVAGEATLRTNADADLQSQIDALSASSDVVDVVGTYADLQDYDTTTLHNNAIIKVLNDSTHDNSIGYFRWVITSGTGSWSYIGAEGPYYTVAETDALLDDYVPTSRKIGAVDLSANVTLSGSFSGTSKSISVSGIPTGNITISKGTGTANYTPSGSNAKSAVTISPKTTSVYSITSVGSKTNGTAASFKQGTDTFTANTPTVIDTSKFSGGSFTRGSFSGGSFTQGTDSFTANVPTKIDTTKFSGGSFTRGSFSGGSFTQGADSFVAPVLTFTPDSSTGNLTISWSAGSFVQGSDSYTAATHDADSFTAASLDTGFYTAGSAASFTQGTDSFTAATHGNDSFTAAKLNTGFYTAGSAASFSQGEDEFTANTPTSVTLPERSQVTGLWNGYNTGVDNTYAAAQTFTGDGAELKGTFSGTSFTSTGTYKPEGSVTVTASH